MKIFKSQGVKVFQAAIIFNEFELLILFLYRELPQLTGYLQLFNKPFCQNVSQTLPLKP